MTKIGNNNKFKRQRPVAYSGFGKAWRARRARAYYGGLGAFDIV